MKKIIITIAIISTTLLIGIAIPKLTVHDTVPDDADRYCVNGAIDKPMKKLSLEWLIRATGKTQVVNATPYYGEAKVYTIFRVPLDFFTIRINCDPTLSMEPVTITDGQKLEYPGTFRDSLVENELKSFRSEKLGISLKYPDGYLLFENETDPDAPYEAHSILIAPEEPILQTIARAEAGLAGEGPWMIGLTFYRNSESLSLEEWLHSDTAHSNFIAEDPTNALTPTTIDDIPAFKYHSEFGLFESDYVSFRYGEWIVLVWSASALADDFQIVLTSIQLKR